jgi:hypothetical protein
MSFVDARVPSTPLVRTAYEAHTFVNCFAVAAHAAKLWDGNAHVLRLTSVEPRLVLEMYNGE